MELVDINRCLTVYAGNGISGNKAGRTVSAEKGPEEMAKRVEKMNELIKANLAMNVMIEDYSYYLEYKDSKGKIRILEAEYFC